MLLARIIEHLCHDELRAHPDNVNNYSNGSWMPKKTLPQLCGIHIEEVLGYTRYLFIDPQTNEIERNWDKVFEHFASYDAAAWAEFEPVDNFEFDAKHWAAVAGFSLKNFPWRLMSASKGANGLDCYAEFFQQERPRAKPIINFKNVTLK